MLFVSLSMVLLPILSLRLLDIVYFGRSSLKRCTGTRSIHFMHKKKRLSAAVAKPFIVRVAREEACVVPLSYDSRARNNDTRAR